ncbi:MAG: GntR family transcriptional regulator [Eubacteriales bacterium]
MVIDERIPRETGREYALRNLKKNIVHLHLEPGAKVSEVELATKLGLSRTPVREALLELAKVNIVQVFPQRGSAISKINHKEVEEAIFMRNTLECAIAELCCDVATPEDINKLEEILKYHEFCSEELNSKDKCFEQDQAFHCALFEIAEKPQVYVSMRNLSIHLDRMCALTLSEVTQDRVIQDHRTIFEGIVQKDKVKSRESMYCHINRAHAFEETFSEQFPHYFE